MSKIPGDFVPLDVRYRRDRAIRSAGVAAELLYIRSLAHAKGNDTGGLIEDYDLPDLTAGMADGGAAVAALVKVGLWVKLSPTSWLIRSWEKWNPARDPSSEGRLGNHNRWHRDRGIVAPDCAFCVPIAPESHAISPPNRPDIAPDDEDDSPPTSGGESQIRREETREEKNSSASGDACVLDAHEPMSPLIPVDAIEDEFSEWWAAYPRKRDKKPAEKAYKSARKRASAETLLAGAEAYAKEVSGRDASKVKHGATWLNNDCWLNEPEDDTPTYDARYW